MSAENNNSVANGERQVGHPGLEKDWVTKAGLRAVVLIAHESHRCGYVMVPKDHPLFGFDYGDNCPALAEAHKKALEGEVGKRGIIDIFCHDGVTPTPSIVFDVHGGLTFAGGGGKYPAESDGWWFGFDAAHSGDGSMSPHRMFNDGPVRSLSYMEQECENLAEQIVSIFPTGVAP